MNQKVFTKNVYCPSNFFPYKQFNSTNILLTTKTSSFFGSKDHLFAETPQDGVKEMPWFWRKETI